jgi:hypothetical protein
LALSFSKVVAIFARHRTVGFERVQEALEPLKVCKLA